MLLDLMRETREFFMRSAETGEYTASGNTLSPAPGALPGQYIALTGSAVNDGVYRARAGGAFETENGEDAQFTQETFTGTVYLLAVPASFSALARKIDAWNEENGSGKEVASESFGTYSVSYAQGANGPVRWQEKYAREIAPYRRRMFKEVPL
ncbi:MAG TPA: hypothetical protein PKL77_09510 [Candidatus Omnitrophota bacterium]|nr:hypothetical protein [Candidatus Omnitrophota bacterium]